MYNYTLERLYQERRLIKLLIKIGYPRYSHLVNRSQEIKTIINSEYAPIDNSLSVFVLFDTELSKKITESGIELLKEMQEKYSICLHFMK